MTTADTHAASHAADRDLVLRFIDEVWNAAEPEAADRFLRPDYRDLTYQGGDAAALKAQVRELARILPDQRSEVIDVAAADGRVVVRLRLTGTHRGDFRGVAAKGNPVSVSAVRWFGIRGGLIADHWALLDTAALLRQMEA
ncbi:MAG TPA: ester cyclase [Azospirillaceae bacterium]|nr:ester cyclase [Azospirillaceae bacterium]